MAGTISIHVSDVKEFKRCRRKWALGQLAELAPIKRSVHFYLGSAVHKFLEVWYKFGDFDLAMQAMEEWMEADVAPIRENNPDLFAEQEVDFIEQQDLARIMVEGYVAQYASEEFRIPNTGGEPIVEYEFSTPILKPDGKPMKSFHYAGTIDMLVRDENGFWILDHKTTSNTNADFIRLDDQNVMYLMFLAEHWPKLAPHLRGFIYNFLRKQKPGPRVKSPLFFREKVYRNSYELQHAREHIFFVTKEMDRCAKNPDETCLPNPTKDCSWDCSFKAVCRAMNDGTSVEDLLDVGFQRRDDDRLNGWDSDWFPRSR